MGLYRHGAQPGLRLRTLPENIAVRLPFLGYKFRLFYRGDYSSSDIGLEIITEKFGCTLECEPLHSTNYSNGGAMDKRLLAVVAAEILTMRAGLHLNRRILS